MESDVQQIEVTALAQLAVAKDAKERRKLEPLGWLWMDLAARKYGWEILAWDWESGATLMVFSPDRAWCVLGPHLVTIGADAGHIDDKAVTELFMALGDVAAFAKRDSFLGCGILKSAVHLPYRE
ncbi:MAG TPA: hypothetical protein PKA88_25180 [Polyangiaceae bacterium]|nr:hypothetical protein [Polyangiaceae bacterium]HMR75960.1 hypothetical protein [Polyangiaceae bacterium]